MPPEPGRDSYRYLISSARRENSLDTVHDFPDDELGIQDNLLWRRAGIAYSLEKKRGGLRAHLIPGHRRHTKGGVYEACFFDIFVPDERKLLAGQYSFPLEPEKSRARAHRCSRLPPSVWD